MMAKLCTRKATGLLHHSENRAAVWSGTTASGAPVHLCANCRAYDLAREQTKSDASWLGGRGVSDSAVYALALVMRGAVQPGNVLNYRNDRIWFWLRQWERLGLVTRQVEVFAMAGGVR